MSDNIKSFLEDVKNKKRDLLVMKLKAASGESVAIKDFKLKKKEIARLLTKVNSSI